MIKPGRMFTTLMKSLCKPPVTLRYPAQKRKMPPNYRGRICFSRDLCIGCKLCVKDCPSKAIEIMEAAASPEPAVPVTKKKFTCDINLARCLYCAQCVDSCPRKALINSDDYELASLDKKALLKHYKE